MLWLLFGNDESRSVFRKAAKSEIAPFELNKEGRNSYALVLRYAGCDLMCPLCYAWRYAWFPKLEGYKLKEQDVLNVLNDLYVLKLDREIVNFIRDRLKLGNREFIVNVMVYGKSK